MTYTDKEIESIISQTLSKFQNQDIRKGMSACWLCDTAEEAIGNAKAAQKQLIQMPLEKRSRLIEAMRKVSLENAEKLARLANQETGYGRVADKTAKNILAAEKTPGIEDLTALAYTGDYGLTLVEAAPYGVIGSITPSTNPTSTVINNAISMIAAGNAVIFNPHPVAKRSSQETMRLLNEAIEKAGGPVALITTVKEPTLESGKAIMESKDIPLLSITGGEAVVKVAMRTGKKVIAAGPGNPPVIVDDTANIPKAAEDIVNGASFDNNVVCIAEKEVFAFSSIVDELVAQMQKHGAYLVEGGDIQKIVDTVLVKKENGYVINRDFVGRDAAVILKASGVSFSSDPRLVIARVDKNHPFICTEMLMPILGISTVKTIEEAVEEAICAEQGCQHSAMIHSTNIKHLSYAAKALNTTIFVKNAPSYAGLGYEAEGYATLTIATPTGEGLTSARSFTRARRCVLHGDFRIV